MLTYSWNAGSNRYSNEHGGRLDTTLRRLQETQPSTAALEIQMIAMSPLNASAVIAKPEGGVVHNYNCRWRATNVSDRRPLSSRNLICSYC